MKKSTVGWFAGGTMLGTFVLACEVTRFLQRIDRWQIAVAILCVWVVWLGAAWGIAGWADERLGLRSRR